jgi:cardiolipin synthase
VLELGLNGTVSLGGLIRSDLLAAVGVVVAIWVTIHVLLHKREVSVAIGWIGLVWLTPLIGGASYAVFGINRVQRRARKLRRSMRRTPRDTAAPRQDIAEHLAPLECAVRRISNRTAESGNDIEMYENGDAAYPPMLEAINTAQSSVALSTYIFWYDDGGKPFVDALIAAHERGVAVRVLVDGIGSGYFRSAVYSHLRRAGVPAARFLHSPLPWRMPFLNMRTHKKILVVDGRVGFTGGMNISAANLVAQKPKAPVRDVNFRLEGPVVGQLTEAFVQDWQFATDEELGGNSWFPELGEAGPAVARVVTSGPDEDIEKIAMVLHEAVACARRTIRIMTPYLLPDERMIGSLALAAMRGTEVDIVIPARSDHILINWAVGAHLGPLIEAGVRIWLNPPPFEHTKIMVVDGVWSTIGSANWDVRSMRLNFELNVEFYHDTLAERLEAFMQSRMKVRLLQKDLRRRMLPIRLRDAGARLMLPYL